MAQQKYNDAYLQKKKKKKKKKLMIQLSNDTRNQ